MYAYVMLITALTYMKTFWGSMTLAKTDASTLATIIKDVSLRMNIPLSNMRAQCYDGASNYVWHTYWGAKTST
jgi:hypothetical protein